MTGGLTVVGPFSGDHGMAEYSRQFRSDLEARGLAATCLDVDLRTLADQRPVDVAPLRGTAGPTLFLLNPPEFLPLARQLGPAFFAGRPTAGLWWWEAPRFPSEWLVAAQLLDEVWAATDYIRDRLASAVGTAWRCPLPTAALAPRVADPTPSASGTRFLVTFDYRSTVERKNPDGALRADLQAFPGPQSGVSLTIKTQAAERVPFEARRLRRLAKGRDDVIFVDRALPRAELDALVNSATCYVSLHRAEGLGLGLLEAMRAGKPVIATGFSGNLQFMPADYPLLVGWRPAPIRRGTPLYGRLGGEWAEPDVAHAAKLMRQVASDPTLGQQAARLGLAHLAGLAKSEGLADFVSASLPRLGRAAHRRPPLDHPVWRPDLRGRRMASLLARVEPPLRRVPWLHKLAMDVHFGRYSLRRRGR